MFRHHIVGFPTRLLIYRNQCCLFGLSIPGRNLEGIHYAMTFLETWQKKQHGNNLDYLKWYAKDKDVIVIGGGDTGCDCIATSLRQVITDYILT